MQTPIGHSWQPIVQAERRFSESCWLNLETLFRGSLYALGDRQHTQILRQTQ
jgi:hypothetical protein